MIGRESDNEMARLVTAPLGTLPLVPAVLLVAPLTAQLAAPFIHFLAIFACSFSPSLFSLVRVRTTL